MSETRDFWSRRKARVAEEAEAEAQALEARAIAEEQAEKTDDEILADLGLPDPDGLGEGDDFSAFMAKVVPDRIRTRALRKLWLTNPVLANVDGLVDYGEDFTDAARVIEDLQTSYQVGKGMRVHVEEMERQAALEAEAEKAADDAAQEPAGEVEDAPEDAPVDAPVAEADVVVAMAEPAGAVPEEITPQTAAPLEIAAPLEVAPEDHPAPAPRRRMRFRFDREEVANA